MKLINFQLDQRTYKEFKKLCDKLNLSISKRIRQLIKVDLELCENLINTNKTE